MKPGRIPCCVPFCRRTADAAKMAPHNEMICQKHWKLVPAETKARYRHVRRRATKIWKAVYRSSKIQQPGREALYNRSVRDITATWERIKREAIERAAGI